MGRLEQVTLCFEDGFNCAQAVLSTTGPELGLDREEALRVAGAFGAGMGRMGETCGAVTGAFMAIGLKYGKTQSEDNESRDRGYELVRRFAAAFASRNGSIVCRELIECDLSTPEGLARAREEGRFQTICPKLVRDAIEIIESLGILEAED